MITRWIIVAMAVAAPALWAAGCSSSMQTSEGPWAGTVVGTSDLAPGKSEASRITVNIDGKDKPLSSLFSEATIVILSNEPCAADTADIVMSSNWLEPSVALLEVSTAPGGCAKEKMCVMNRGNVGKRIVGLCDSDDLIRKALNVGRDTAVVVVDSDGFVRDYGTLSDYDALRLKAEYVARESLTNKQPWGS